jgi:hypothetical protein
MAFEILDESSPHTGRFELIDDKPSRTRSIASAPIKGAVKGAHELASFRDPIQKILGLNDLKPNERKAIEKILPTQDKSLEKGLERAGRLAVSTIGGPESLLAQGARVAGGAALGQVAEEAGAPEWAQGLAELAAFMSPKFGKELLPRKSQREAVDFLRGKGLSDKEIAPLIKKENVISRNLKRLSVSERLKESAQSTSEKIGENYNILKSQGKEKFLKGADAVAFDDKLSERLGEITPGFGRLIEKSVEDLRNKGISQKNLIDFYQDINRTVKGQVGGKAVLNSLKPIILEGLEKIDPAAAKEYQLINEFYSKNKKFLKSVTPGIGHQVYSAGKILGTIGSLALGNFWVLKGWMSEKAIRELSKQFLTNPRLQNLGKQVVESIKSNKMSVARELSKRFEKELSDENKKIFEKFSQESRNTKEESKE